MSLPNEQPLHKLQFYVTTPYKCGYLPNKLAQSLIASPQHLIDANIYNGLISQGFRRSGKFAYRPHCENCRACIAVRLVLSTFAPTRGQKRASKQHTDLTAQVMPLHYNQEHFELYSSYQSLRHHDENAIEAKDDDEEQYRQFLCQSNVESLMIEFRNADNQIKIVSVIDVVKDGVSAVYTFYDALETKASYGTYAIMWLAEWTKSLDLPYLYLGYWIQDSPKMAYKQKFNPQEKLIDGEWQ
ncbi:arginyltransferase [Methylotenera versatilis]|uniref:arginyltransferase n=1 Tax=Methylotenera versatilis TaxID=1055487 RepID=UPI00064555FE|nr:arginyltransferase [Methylotenera versatilis]